MLGVHRTLSRKADLMLLGALDLFETHRHYEGRRAVLTGLRSMRLALQSPCRKHQDLPRGGVEGARGKARPEASVWT